MSARASSPASPASPVSSASPDGPRQTVERFLAAVVSPSPGDMADCYAECIVIEMPFASGIAPERVQTTREEIRAFRVRRRRPPLHRGPRRPRP